MPYVAVELLRERVQECLFQINRLLDSRPRYHLNTPRFLLQKEGICFEC